MVSGNVTVTSAQGLHMRPASLLVNGLSRFNSNIMINYEQREINAKSILNILAAGIRKGSVLEVTCTDEDENEALEETLRLISGRLDEWCVKGNRMTQISGTDVCFAR